MPFAKNFLERKNEEFLFYCPERNGAKRVLTQILERKGGLHFGGLNVHDPTI